MTSAALPSSPAFARNASPILEVLRALAWPDGAILEIGSGPGEHAVHFARALRPRAWIPSDRPGQTGAIEARRREAGLSNLAAPLSIDLLDSGWPAPLSGGPTLAGIVAINVLHIAPPEAIDGLFTGAGRALAPGALLYLYGPYRSDARPIEPSNQAFDERIRARLAGAGLRREEDVVASAKRRGFALGENLAMPSNNRSLWFRREDRG